MMAARSVAVNGPHGGLPQVPEERRTRRRRRPRPRAGADGRPSARKRLAARIAALRPGERLPAEPELAAELDVSRPTLREAMQSAEDEGLVLRRPGVGTVKTHRPHLINDLSVNTGVSDLIRAHGLEPGTRGLSVERRYADHYEAGRLGLQRPARVWVVDRVRTAGGLPVIASRDVVPEEMLRSDELTLAALQERSLYAYLSDKGHPVQHGVAYVQPEVADSGLADRLEVKEGTLLLRLVQIDYGEGGRPLLYSDEHHLPDAFEFSVSRRVPVGEMEGP
jgi:GntR family transcriptional regulator